ncbi:sensor histidine kinase [Butyrivibrio sp. INlla21]|uniref:sensor histidine kinase n=1 Tax=Butyrivibrio sp. INlla21 TaxID=1520811 RepID=UPI0008E4DE45|nr:sensor histidine kinase [Butyrivibrio sp. INlla21]SFU94631.1 two-component system, sensor histidine kinase YesM [Butyrivibrio sp. INlla21]
MNIKKNLLQFYDNNSKRTSLSSSLKQVIFGIIFIAIVSFLISTYYITEKERKEYGIREAESVIKTLSNNIYSETKNYIDLSRLIMTEGRLVTFLRADTDDVDIGMINDARYGIMSILNVKEGVDSVIVFREDMKRVVTDRFSYKYNHPLIEQDIWKKDIYNGRGRAVVSLNSNKIATRADNKPVVTVGRAIYDIDSQRRRGLMLMNISASVYQKMLNQLHYSDICIMGIDGTYLAGNKELVPFFETGFDSAQIVHKNDVLDHERILISGCNVSNLPIVILKVSSYGSEGIPYKIIYALLFLLVVFILMTIYVARFIQKNITDPVFELSSSMERNKRSGHLKKINIDMSSNELDMLKTDYNSMIDHVNELIATLIEKEKTLQKAEMRVLQEQIKPHFLYNSIETIGFLAMDAGADRVHDALETLGSFYRNFLSKGDREIPLSREVCIVKDYIALQKLRYGDIIEDIYDIAEDTENFIVPKLILQPLVENSIYHGIRLKGERGIIRISSRMEENELHLSVRDTGVGMDADQIEKILSRKKINQDELDAESFGLWGTIERIRIFYDKEDVVKINSEIGEYTEIEFIIPHASHYGVK